MPHFVHLCRENLEFKNPRTYSHHAENLQLVDMLFWTSVVHVKSRIHLFGDSAGIIFCLLLALKILKKSLCIEMDKRARPVRRSISAMCLAACFFFCPNGLIILYRLIGSLLSKHVFLQTSHCSWTWGVFNKPSSSQSITSRISSKHNEMFGFNTYVAF